MQPYYVSRCAHRVSFVLRHRLSVTIHRHRSPIHLHLQCMHDRIAAKLKMENVLEFSTCPTNSIRTCSKSFDAQWLDCIQRDQCICCNNRCHYQMSLHSFALSTQTSKWKSFRIRRITVFSYAITRPFECFHNVWLTTFDSCFFILCNSTESFPFISESRRIERELLPLPRRFSQEINKRIQCSSALIF